ncbi:MAG: hypothetical protein ACPLQP_01505 [Moorellaceae bacterium]
MFATVEYWSVLTIYQQAQHLKYRALSSMEINGGLTVEEEQDLRARLEPLAREGTIQIRGTLLAGGAEPVYWPDKVRLEIEFVPRVDGFMARTLIGGNPGQPVKIRIGGEALSAKIAPERGGARGGSAAISDFPAVPGNGVGGKNSPGGNSGGRQP